MPTRNMFDYETSPYHKGEGLQLFIVFIAICILLYVMMYFTTF